MKLPALILYLLLSLFVGDRVQNTRSAEQLQASATGSRILEEEKDCNTYTCPKSDLCLTPGQGGTFTGQNPSSQLKSNFRLVRYGCHPFGFAYICQISVFHLQAEALADSSAPLLALIAPHYSLRQTNGNSSRRLSEYGISNI